MVLGLIRSFLGIPLPPNLRNNTNIIDLNMLETPKVWTHLQHGAGNFFFCKWACNTQRGQVAVPEKGRGAVVYIPLNKSSHTSICICQVWDLIQGTQSDGSFWPCIPSRPLAEADALCAWDSLWDESTVCRESATYVWTIGDLPQCFWLHRRIPKV